MEININRQTYEHVLDMLRKMSPQFTPPLSNTLDLNTYADKLANNATFLTYSDNEQIVGVIVFYPNKTTSVLYIPLVWVEKECRGAGIAKRLFGSIIEFGKQEGFSSIDLEVLKDNIPAKYLYGSIGFYNIEDRRTKFLMRYNLI